MEKTERLLKSLDLAYKRLKLYVNAIKEPLFINRAKKLLKHPLKVLRVVLYKARILKQPNVSVQMFWGKKIVLPLWDENALIAYYTGSFGLAEIFLVRYFIKNIKQNDVLYDIGSSFGLYTALGEELGARVYSFEPNPETSKYIIKNANKNTIVEAVAISDTDGSVEFHDTFSSNKSGMSSMFPDIARGTASGAYKVISVRAITLDEYIKTHEIPKIIKMDVMNADYLVLKGGKSLFTLYSPVLAVRMYNTPMALERTRMSLSLLSEYGYNSFSLTESGELVPVKIEPEGLKFATTFIFKK